MDGGFDFGKMALKGLKWFGISLAVLVLALVIWIGLYQFTGEAEPTALPPPPIATFTPAPTATPTPTLTPIPTDTPLPTYTPTLTPTATPTETPAPSLTPTTTPTPTATLLNGRIMALVTDVISGDTIEVAFGEERRRVRYVMVDAPDPVTERGQAALRRNQELVEDQAVLLEPDSVNQPDTFDAEGSLLRYVFLPDGRLINEIMLREGLAQFKSYSDHTRREYALRQAQAAAMVGGSGQWGTPTLTPQATATPTSTPEQTPTPDVPYGSGGLGLDREDWEAVHTYSGPGATLGQLPAETYDNGQFSVLFEADRVAWIDRIWPAEGGVPQADAESLAGTYMPTDRIFIRMYYPPELAGAAVSVYYSPSLEKRFPPSAWTLEPGIFAVIFEDSGEAVTRLVIMLNDPVTMLRQGTDADDSAPAPDGSEATGTPPAERTPLSSALPTVTPTPAP